MTDLEIDPDANPVVRANAKFVLWWQSKNEAWSKSEDIRNPVQWVLWEATWPLLLVSHVLWLVYSFVSTVVLTPLEWVW